MPATAPSNRYPGQESPDESTAGRITSLDLDALERLARAATPGPWITGAAENDRRGEFMHEEDEILSATANDPPWDDGTITKTTVIEARNLSTIPDADRAYLLAVDPQTVLALIALTRI